MPIGARVRYRTSNLFYITFHGHIQRSSIQPGISLDKWSEDSLDRISLTILGVGTLDSLVIPILPAIRRRYGGAFRRGAGEICPILLGIIVFFIVFHLQHRLASSGRIQYSSRRWMSQLSPIVTARYIGHCTRHGQERPKAHESR